ncbi:AraC-like DNA-binding protein [Dyadobacter jejuensis]|uniref:AraC-like DNA-binding protein n=1 Tax=Dyadobacter jejuensis TaxID=1082580 RepID=A0A316AU32_9BACT|nr:AraC family transcriptional regulator [Dyadobacter jejuensis]PWJ60190.1 AraC-like DNA-binding protein [Dyadobacter jejuensis]
MHIEQTIKPFEIHIEILDHWQKRPHQHNFFELVYIDKGTGHQCINQMQFPYAQGNIFLLPPLDCHSFKIEERTTFYFIRFTDLYFTKEAMHGHYKEWFQKLSYVLSNYNKVAGDIIQTRTSLERELLVHLIKQIHQEYLTKDDYSEPIIESLLMSTLNILARNIEKRYVDEGHNKDYKFGEIIRYIQHHLYDKQKLSLEAIASEFNIAPTYFSEYFKKHSEYSFQEYIIKSKLKLAESYIKHSQYSIKEIAYMLGFTDSSHLSKSFKKNYSVTIQDFKKGKTQACAPQGQALLNRVTP